MSVMIESSKPLEELSDSKYAKSKRHGPAKRMLDSLPWASEDLLLCVVREKGGDGAESVKVRSELAVRRAALLRQRPPEPTAAELAGQESQRRDVATGGRALDASGCGGVRGSGCVGTVGTNGLSDISGVEASG